jgi:hypothetical protein
VASVLASDQFGAFFEHRMVRMPIEALSALMTCVIRHPKAHSLPSHPATGQLASRGHQRFWKMEAEIGVT